MTEFQVYDVTGTCVVCTMIFATKSFKNEPRNGLCPVCIAAEEAHIRSLQQPPKSYSKPKPPEPPKQYRWEPPD